MVVTVPGAQPTVVQVVEPQVEAPSEGAAAGLDDREREILAFERQWWKYAGAKEEAVRDLFGMSATRYYQVLNTLIDSPAALAHDPLLVKRLRRLRSTRQRARSGHRLADEKG
ncbi:DUF3263 domain-containing protein [Antribacter gilvus]|uniref:DUF3263 domain-containing protein n=1 Tax=Antribacter gilvus TaxID=2304675 RepID=UPI000F76AA44|nr:DUF3263 domain-containing protein [Antribacter gilvus]